MSWPDPPRGRTDPAYYRDAADRIEAVVRADFALYYQLRLIAPYGETPDQVRELSARADALATKWGRHESPAPRVLWGQLQAAVSGWEVRPEATRKTYDRLAQAKAAGDLPVDEKSWRNLRQAAEVTGHLETVISGSVQDGARWRPTGKTVGQQAEKTSLLDRALGGRGPDITNLAEVDAIIAETEELLAREEELGDLDTGDNEHTSLLPDRVRSAPVTYPYINESAHEYRQIAALRQVQDYTAEHARLVDRWDGSPDQDRAQIARLESLLDAMRTARLDAAAAGVPVADIEAAYLAGREGTYWHEHPGDPQRGRIARLIEERDRATAEAASLRDLLAARHVEPASAAQPEPNPLVVSRDELALQPEPSAEGARIGEAIDAALPNSDVTDWSPTDTTEDTPAARHDTNVDVSL